MPSAEEELGTQARASLDALLRRLDEQIGAIKLPEIPRPTGRANDPVPAMESLLRQVEDLCTQRAVNIREQERWFIDAERAFREDDDVRAKDSLARHAEHLRLAQEADALLTEFRALIIDVRRSLSPTNERAADGE